MLGLCRALLRDPAEAEDAAQQTFLSAHRSLLNGADPREPAAWLATIARNECWSRISSRMRRPLATDETEGVAAPDDTLTAAIRSADLAALWRAIRELPRAQRDALLLREFGGLRYDELAVALAVTEPAVESLLVRARSRLRAQLETVYASVAPLARFLVGSGAPAIAAKAAALGIGAAAVTGGVAVAPEMLTRHHLQPPPATTTTAAKKPRRDVKTVAAVVVAPLAVVPARTATAVGPEVRHRRRHDGEHQQRDDGRTTTVAETTTATPVVVESGHSGPGPGAAGGDGSSGGSSGGNDGDSGSGDGSSGGSSGGDDGPGGGG